MPFTWYSKLFWTDWEFFTINKAPPKNYSTAICSLSASFQAAYYIPVRTLQGLRKYLSGFSSFTLTHSSKIDRLLLISHFFSNSQIKQAESASFPTLDIKILILGRMFWMDGWIVTGQSITPLFQQANMKQVSTPRVSGQQHGWFHTTERCNTRCHTLQLHRHIKR